MSRSPVKHMLRVRRGGVGSGAKAAARRRASASGSAGAAAAMLMGMRTGAENPGPEPPGTARRICKGERSGRSFPSAARAANAPSSQMTNGDGQQSKHERVDCVEACPGIGQRALPRCRRQTKDAHGP